MLGPNVNECVRNMESISISVRRFIELGQSTGAILSTLVWISDKNT